MLSQFTLINIMTGQLLTFCYFFILTKKKWASKVQTTNVFSRIKIFLMKKSSFVLTVVTKSLILCSFSIVTITGLSQQAKGYNLEACVKDPMTKPQKIDLLQPIDQKMINCIPKLDSIASRWQSTANSMLSAINQVRIGNDGENNIEKLEYNVDSNTIAFVLRAKAKHTWKVTIPEIKESVPIPQFKTRQECVLPLMGQTGCKKKVFGQCILPTFGQVGCKKWVGVKVPDGVKMEMRVISPEKTISESASTTCKYDYTFNLTTTEQKPIFNCGQGILGNFKLDASAITSILNGQMPTIGTLISSVNLTPPGFKDANRDEYETVKQKIIADHPGSIVYFSSQSFVNWASTKNQAVNGVAAFFSAGSYSAELIRQIEERLRTELTFMSIFTTQTGMQLGTEQIVSMMTGKGNLDLNGYKVSVKVVNTPEIIQKCIVSGDCIPAIELPRLGFAIIATKI